MIDLKKIIDVYTSNLVKEKNINKLGFVNNKNICKNVILSVMCNIKILFDEDLDFNNLIKDDVNNINTYLMI